jgi:MoaA/NifB/PqqE/SkfB family radical SAM enzyme
MGFWNGLIRDDPERGALLAAVERGDVVAGQLAPRVASLLLTYRCQLRCGYCPFHARAHEGPEAGEDAWVEVLDRLAAAGVRRVSFSGGEPTLHAALPALVAHAHGLGLTTSLVTNGHLLDELLPRLVSAGLDALTVSLDCIDPAVYRRIRGGPPGSARPLLASLRAAREGQRLWVGVNTVLSRENLPQLPGLLEFCHAHALPIQVQPVNHVPGTPDLRPDPEALAHAVALLIEARIPDGPVENSREFLGAIPEFRRVGRLPRPLRCMVPYVEMVVTPDLEVQPCCMAPAAGRLPEDPVAGIWSGAHYARWRTAASRGECTSCMLLYHEVPS